LLVLFHYQYPPGTGQAWKGEHGPPARRSPGRRPRLRFATKLYPYPKWQGRGWLRPAAFIIARIAGGRRGGWQGDIRSGRRNRVAQIDPPNRETMTRDLPSSDGRSAGALAVDDEWP